MLPRSHANQFFIAPAYQPWMRQIGLDADAVFSHPNIVAWRKLPDRENCTLDARVDGRSVRLHIKRWSRGHARMVENEVRGIELLKNAGIATVPLIGWGRLADHRSFVITEDLSGYRDSEKLVSEGTSFEGLLKPTAELAGRLHRAGLHHRDLYLCHFFAGESDPSDIRLIDVARVARLGRWRARRWIIKDLAQFIYSTKALPVTDEQRQEWLDHYAAISGSPLDSTMRNAIEHKVNAIARHDRKLRQSQPLRNVSISADR